MLTFHGRPAAKVALIKSLEVHAKYDEFLKGTYYSSYRTSKGAQRFKGCAVGCTIGETAKEQVNIHKRYEEYYGIPRFIAHIEDDVFERLSVEASKSWPLDFANAIPVGADLTGFEDKILRTLCRRKKVMDTFERYCTNESVTNLKQKLKQKDYPIKYAFADMRAACETGRTAPTGTRNLLTRALYADDAVNMTWILCLFAKFGDADFDRAYNVTGYAYLRDKAAPFLALLTLQLLRSYKGAADPVSPARAFLSLQHAGVKSIPYFNQIPKKYRPMSEGRYNILLDKSLSENALGDVA